MGRKKVERARVDAEGGQPSAFNPLVPPELHIEMAVAFAKMLNVGCPPVRAVLYCFPQLEKEVAELTAQRWMNLKITHDCLADLHGGKWMDLPLDQRMKLAREKHVSEMAFYLWTTNFNGIEHREGLEKMRQAREVLANELGLQKGEDDALSAFSRFAADYARAFAEAQSLDRKVARTAKSDVNPAMQANALDSLLHGPHGKA